MLPFLQGTASGAGELARGRDHRPHLVQPPHPEVGNDFPKVTQCTGIREGPAVFIVCKEDTLRKGFGFVASMRVWDTENSRRVLPPGQEN